jgi:hypothetical protein
MEAFQDKNDTEEKKKPSFRDILVEFMGYTSVHGFGRLVEATTFVWRIFWILAILVASGIFAVEAMNLFKLYSSRPVQTSVSVAFEKVLQWSLTKVPYIQRPHFPCQVFQALKFKADFHCCVFHMYVYARKSLS